MDSTRLVNVDASHALLSAVRDSLGLVPSVLANTGVHANKCATMPRSSLSVTAETLGSNASTASKLRSVQPGDAERTDAETELEDFMSRLSARRPSTAPLAKGTSGTSWSKDAVSLKQALARLLPFEPSPLLTTAGLLSFFTHLDLSGHGVEAVDGALLAATGLRELTLSRNKLRAVQGLPHAVQSFQAFHNRISCVALPRPHPALLHLGLGHNGLTGLDWGVQEEGRRGGTATARTQSRQSSAGGERRGGAAGGLDRTALAAPLPPPPPSTLSSTFPSLASLDISHNCITDLRATLVQLVQLPRLRHLVLHGNPASLCVNAPVHVLTALRRLESLDDRPHTDVDKAHLGEQVRASGQRFGLDAGAVYGGIACSFEVGSVTGLPGRASVLASFGLTEAGDSEPMAQQAGAVKPAAGPAGKPPSAPVAVSVAPALPLPSPPPCSYLLRFSLPGIAQWEVGPGALVSGGEPHPQQLPAVVLPVQVAPVPGKAPAASRPPVDTSAAPPHFAPAHPPRATASVVFDSSRALHLEATVATRDVLHFKHVVVTLVEVCPAREGGAPDGQERVLGACRLPLHALLRPSEGGVVRVGALDGDGALTLHLTALPRPALEALADVRRRVSAVCDARRLSGGEQSGGSGGAGGAGAAAMPAGPSRPASAVGPKPLALKVPGGDVAAGGDVQGSHHPLFLAVASSPWGEGDMQRHEASVARHASVVVGARMTLTLVDL